MSCVVAGSSNKSQPTTSTVQCLSNGSSALDSFTHPLFPTNRPVSTSPQGHTPISQDGSIAPVYILLWTNGYLLGGFRLTHDPAYQASAIHRKAGLDGQLNIEVKGGLSLDQS